MSENDNPAPVTHSRGNEERLKRVGKHLIETAFAWGWQDNGEGAFEYVQRISYEQGKEDGSAFRTAVPDAAIATIWKAAMTVAANIVIKHENDANDDDAPMRVIDELSSCVRGIKKWMEVDEVYLEELRPMVRAALTTEGQP